MELSEVGARTEWTGGVDAMYYMSCTLTRASIICRTVKDARERAHSPLVASLLRRVPC